MVNLGGTLLSTLPEKAIFVQCTFLSEEDTRVGVAMMTTVSSPRERKEPYYIMIPINPEQAVKLEHIMLVIDGEVHEARIDQKTQVFIPDD